MIKTYIVDAFTDKAFRGNPAGVCIVDNPLSDELMLQIAGELNLSETAFVQPAEDGATFSIRYFSPKMEITLCGHATFASAKVIFAKSHIEKLQFITAQNLELPVVEQGPKIVMEFPAYGMRSAEVPDPLLSALGIQSPQNVAYNSELEILLLEISDVKALKALTPDFEALVKSHNSINGVVVTAASDKDGFDFHSRYFWPWSGTNEDPVTGGTHCFLAPYWAKRLGRSTLRSFQSSKRSGAMDVEYIDGKVIIGAQAVMVFEGALLI